MSDLNEKAILSLITSNRSVAMANCLAALEPLGDRPGEVVYTLNDLDGFFDLYKGLLSDEEIGEAFDTFGQVPFTNAIGELEMDIWVEAAKSLGFSQVVVELERIKKEGV